MQNAKNCNNVFAGNYLWMRPPEMLVASSKVELGGLIWQDSTENTKKLRIKSEGKFKVKFYFKCRYKSDLGGLFWNNSISTRHEKENYVTSEIANVSSADQ